MMAGNGGYEKPGTPAMVSGVGAQSARTDGQPSADDMVQAAKYLSGQKYGQNANLNQQEQAVPLAGSLQASDVKAPEVGSASPVANPTAQAPLNFKPLTESGDANVPLTHGMPFGSGANSAPGVTPSTLRYNPETGTLGSDSSATGEYRTGLTVLQNLAKNIGGGSSALQYLLNSMGQDN